MSMRIIRLASLALCLTALAAGCGRTELDPEQTTYTWSVRTDGPTKIVIDFQGCKGVPEVEALRAALGAAAGEVLASRDAVAELAELRAVELAVQLAVLEAEPAHPLVAGHATGAPLAGHAARKQANARARAATVGSSMYSSSS